MRRSLRIAAGLWLGSTACAAGDTGASSSTAATIGDGSDGQDDSTSGPASTSSGPGPATSTTSASAGADIDDGGSTNDEGSSSDTGAFDPCAGELETFAVDPVWAAIGIPDGGNAYGWVANGIQAGGDPGEIGGMFQRSGNRTVFADAITATVADTCIAAHGRLVIPAIDGNFNSYVQFGHFALAGGPGVGFALAEGGGGTVRVFMSGGGVDEVAFTIEDPSTARAWSYVLDPSTAMMTLTLEGYGSSSRPVTPDGAMTVLGLDSFGIHHDPHDNAGDSPGKLEVYLDEIAYTR